MTANKRDFVSSPFKTITELKECKKILAEFNNFLTLLYFSYPSFFPYFSSFPFYALPFPPLSNPNLLLVPRFSSQIQCQPDFFIKL